MNKKTLKAIKQAEKGGLKKHKMVDSLARELTAHEEKETFLHTSKVFASRVVGELLNEVTPVEMEQTKIKMQLAARIEDCMQINGWSKSEFADRVGKHPSEITKWLSGTQNFTIEVMTEIAFALGVEVTSLLE